MNERIKKVGMTQQEEVRIRQMILDVIGQPLQEIKGHIELIHVQNVRIEEQTTKHNGRMEKIETKIDEKIMPEINELQKKNLVSFINCPNTKDVAEIKQREFGRKEVVKFAGIVSTAIATAISLFFAWLKL